MIKRLDAMCEFHAGTAPNHSAIMAGTMLTAALFGANHANITGLPTVKSPALGPASVFFERSLFLLLPTLLVIALFVGIALLLLLLLLRCRSRRCRLLCLVGGRRICHSIYPFKVT